MKMKQQSKILWKEILPSHWSIIIVNKCLGLKTQSLEFKITLLQKYIHKTPIIMYVIVDKIIKLY
jgi:hypothetical protein